MSSRLTTSFYEFRTSVKSLDEVVYPLELKYRNVTIRILEISKLEHEYDKLYFVVVQLCKPTELGFACTRPFTIWCRDVEEFVTKLRYEVLSFRVVTWFHPDLLAKV